MWYDSSEGIKAERDRRLRNQIKRGMLNWTPGWWSWTKMLIHNLLKGLA